MRRYRRCSLPRRKLRGRPPRVNVMARALGKPAVDLWDFFAPAPARLAVEGDGEGKLYTFEEGVELIADAVGEVDEDAGAFVRMMKEKKWIEASRNDNKRPGAYVHAPHFLNGARIGSFCC